MKKIIVTGGAGFIGSHLCEELLKRGNFVICLDNEYTGAIDNIYGLMANPNFKYLNWDVRDPYFFECDEIYNLACPASPIHYQKDMNYTTETSYLGMKNALECAKVRKAKVLQASTSEIYGDPKIHPQVEAYWGNVNSYGPRSCYDEGKRIAETLCFNYSVSAGVKHVIARIFNTYGPRMQANDGRIISNFITQAIEDKPITIYGNGSQTRSFCYVSDTVRGLILLMEKAPIGTICNIGNPNEQLVYTMAEKIKQMCDSRSEIEFHSLPQDDPCKRKPDISRAKELLKWEPEVELDDGLARTIEYFRKLRSF